jgi:hypothetical protein
VVGILGRLEILKVTAYAQGAGQFVIIIDMALRALDGGMESSKWPSCARMIEAGPQPRGRAVAYRAVRWKASSRMRRVVRGIEIAHMTRSALSVGTGQLVIVACVALLTGDCGVETGESPSGAGVIEPATPPIGCVMALLASLGESSLHVVRVVRCLVILQVTRHASGISAGQLVVSVHVTLQTRRIHVGAG